MVLKLVIKPDILERFESEIGSLEEKYLEKIHENYHKIISCTVRSLLNELARLTVLNTVKQASLFNRDLRVFQKKPVAYFNPKNDKVPQNQKLC